ncbi:MAG: hypothetical protein NTX66_04420 [Candidatus Falkowbacteria bacterium]|nr:hypothetical protein [Candidatus Falkowbacteria bacterium]
MKIKIFKKSRSYLEARPRLLKALELTIKTLCVLLIPVIFSALILSIWILIFYRYNIHFDNGMEVIVTAAWIPVFGILYSLLTAIVLSTVWTEYKTMRAAVKRWDIDTFMDLRDEEMSPLVHAMVLMFSLALLLAFMVLDYPSFSSGLILIGSTSYLLSLIFFVIVEIDNPCSGFWFIKSIPEKWLKINPKAWREKRSEEAKRRLEEIWPET